MEQGRKVRAREKDRGDVKQGRTAKERGKKHDRVKDKVKAREPDRTGIKAATRGIDSQSIHKHGVKLEENAKQSTDTEKTDD